MNFESTLRALESAGNMRAIPADTATSAIIDMSSNDYLGLGTDKATRRMLLEYALEHDLPVTSSASRLLSAYQREYALTESLLESLYHGRKALLFNSGYHANTGLVSALADRDTLIVADKLVHASIIDGIVLSRAQCVRFRHNDYDHLEKILTDKGKQYANVLIVAESVYSMDGDTADIARLAELKHSHPSALLYIDEAHAFGVEGKHGIGLAADKDADVIVGTFGKALGSVGAFAVMSATLKQFIINKARSFIFSTALPPVNAAWSRLLIEKMTGMDKEREHLRRICAMLATMLGSATGGHIQPWLVGDASKAVELSRMLMAEGVKVLPIRTPTVPAGTERLRFSLSAALTGNDMLTVQRALTKCGITS